MVDDAAADSGAMVPVCNLGGQTWEADCGFHGDVAGSTQEPIPVHQKKIHIEHPVGIYGIVKGVADSVRAVGADPDHALPRWPRASWGWRLGRETPPAATARCAGATPSWPAGSTSSCLLCSGVPPVRSCFDSVVSGHAPMVDRRPSRGARRLRCWARRVVAPVVCVAAVVALGRTSAVVNAEIINVKVTRTIVCPLLGYWRRRPDYGHTPQSWQGWLPWRLAGGASPVLRLCGIQQGAPLTFQCGPRIAFHLLRFFGARVVVVNASRVDWFCACWSAHTGRHLHRGQARCARHDGKHWHGNRTVLLLGLSRW